MKINNKGLELLKRFEGCGLDAYKDLKGIWTIGFGHTGSEAYLGAKISMARALELLEHDLDQFEYGVERLVKVPLSSNQFSALVCFSYNIGLGALAQSTLLRKINNKDYVGASKEFSRWDKANGKVVRGLVNRRKAEKDLFNQS